MEDLFSKEVQGYALYLELRKPRMTSQIIITPDGLQETGELAFSQVFFRTINPSSKRVKWGNGSLRAKTSMQHTLMYGHDPIQHDLEEATLRRMSELANILQTLGARGYKLVKNTPIFVEVTKNDMNSLRKGELPAKMWTRVKAVRTAKGFPTEPVSSAEQLEVIL